MNTRKQQKKWLSDIIESLPDDLRNETGNPFKTVAEDIRRIYQDNNGQRYYNAATDAALHYLKGCGLHGFPIYTEEHETQLKMWGYSVESARRNAPKFFQVAAGFLVEVLKDNNQPIN